MIREPAVAGTFYPSDPQKLKESLSKFIQDIPKKIKAKGIVVPHAGYMYSGKIAGEVYSRVEIPNRLIILSPNHTGMGVPFSIMPSGSWRLPMGEAKIDEDLASKMMDEFPKLEEDTSAHMQEHSLEVQLPFIQYLKENFSFVPITIGHVSYQDCKEFGEAIARIIEKETDPVLIVASSDMNHYEEHYKTLEKDQLALDEILNQDPMGLYNVVHDKNISMCGIIPTTVMLTACNELRATRAELIDHKTSGDVTGDLSGVVGYAGIIIS